MNIIPPRRQARLRVRRTARMSGSRGQSVVELALLVPVLMVLLVAAIDFGRLMQARVTAEAATRAGASWGAGILANAREALGPVYSMNSGPNCTTFGPTCNIEARSCAEAAGFPNYSGGLLLTGAGDNPDQYRDCANNYAGSTNAVTGVCNPTATQSNPFFSVVWRRAAGSTFTPTRTDLPQVGDTVEVDGTFCFKTFLPWPAVPSPIMLNTAARYTVQP